jgi:acetolactate synthase-1/2/3 large subunit
LKASDALARFLIAHKVQTCFELVVGMITHLLDSLAESRQFNIVSMHHEQAAAFAAEGVARYRSGDELHLQPATESQGPVTDRDHRGWCDGMPAATGLWVKAR